MATLPTYALAALFLPLFPLSIVFNRGLSALRRDWMRALVLLVWPQAGVWILSHAHGAPPGWLNVWAALTALLYAYRALAVREAGRWIGFVAVSAWALLWADPARSHLLAIQALGLSLPLAVAVLVTGVLERRFGAAHTALRLGLATTAPRLAALFVIAILAVVATPVFPNFFILVATVARQAPVMPAMALTVLAVWMLWAWSGARLVQGLVAGPGRAAPGADLTPAAAWAYAALFLGLAGAGITMGGLLL